LGKHHTLGRRHAPQSVSAHRVAGRLGYAHGDRLRAVGVLAATRRLDRSGALFRDFRFGATMELGRSGRAMMMTSASPSGGDGGVAGSLSEVQRPTGTSTAIAKFCSTDGRRPVSCSRRRYARASRAPKPPPPLPRPGPEPPEQPGRLGQQADRQFR
jgi:hypothetical protein